MVISRAALASFLSSLVVTALVTGCGSDGGISSEPLAGEIDGMPWTFVGGSTNEFLSENSDTFFAELLAQNFGACSSTHSTQPYVIANVPKEVGSYDLSNELTATIVVGTDNLIATEGEITVTKITAQTITGGIRAVYDDANAVDGQFEITICTGPDAN